MAHEDLERTPNDGLERYYDAVLAAVRASLTRISAAAQLSNNPEKLPSSKVQPADPTGSAELSPDGAWLPFRLPDGITPPHGMRLPPEEGTGFQFVDIARLGHFALIAFHWHDAGDELFVYTFDMQDIANRNFAVGMADTIMTTNILEDVRKGWQLHTPLARIRGLTFIE